MAKQRPYGSAYVIGEPGLITALYDAGYSMNDTNPDYVVVGETKNYNYSMLETAVSLVRKGKYCIYCFLIVFIFQLYKIHYHHYYYYLHFFYHHAHIGARLIGTNLDITDRSFDSFIPACGSLIKPIELASG